MPVKLSDLVANARAKPSPPARPQVQQGRLPLSLPPESVLARRDSSTGLYGVDLCAGAGIYSLAFILEGIEAGEVCEIDPDALATIRRNIDPAPRNSARPVDAHTWTPAVPEGGLDVLYGGPPCQPWSTAGAGKGQRDERDLFPEVIRLATQTTPRVICVENVGSYSQDKEGGRGILAAKHRDYVEAWWQDLRAAGYEGVIWALLAADYGTPQARPRVFFVAWPKGASWGERLREPPPATHAPPDVAKELGLLPWVSGFDRLNEGCCRGYGYHSCAYLNNLMGMCEGCWDGQSYQEAENESAVELTEGELAYLFRDPRRVSRHPWSDLAGERLPSSVEVRMGGKAWHSRWLAPTMTANMAKGVPYNVLHAPDGPRKISVREAAKLMDLPQWWVFAGKPRAQARQVGNGVSLATGRAVARHLVRAFGRKVQPEPRVEDLGLWSSGCNVGPWPQGGGNRRWPAGRR